MLWTPGNEFQSQVDNFGATYSDSGLGTAVTAHATNANQKGTAVSLIAGASVPDDVFGISICFAGGNSNGSARTFLADLLVDPAGGTSWSTIINNLYFQAPSISMNGFWFYFPLYLKNGTSIGCQVQCSVANITTRCAVRLHCRPSRPDLLKCGSIVETFGATTASSTGTAMTPGTNAQGSYTASLGTTSHDLWWWQAGWGCTDTTMTLNCLWLDVAVNATNKVICAENIPVMTNTNESAGKAAMGSKPPIRFISGGQGVFIRGMSNGTPDSGNSVVAYGLGG